jgi:hypothetical protein
MRQVLAIIPILVFLSATPLYSKNDKEKRGAGRNEYPAARRTEGHRPQDLNGDGRITRNEWPGNDASFRRLDRNADGAITDYDRNYSRSTRQRSTHRSPARSR